jgi:hypothetical protein
MLFLGMQPSLDLLHKSEKLTISNFGFWILDFGLRDLGFLQEVYCCDTSNLPEADPIISQVKAIATTNKPPPSSTNSYPTLKSLKLLPKSRGQTIQR